MSTQEQDFLARLDAALAEEGDPQAQAPAAPAAQEDTRPLGQKIDAALALEQGEKVRSTTQQAEERVASVGQLPGQAADRIVAAGRVRRGQLPSGSGVPTVENAQTLEALQTADPSERAQVAQVIADPTGVGVGSGNLSQGNQVLATMSPTEEFIARNQNLTILGGVSRAVENLSTVIAKPLEVAEDLVGVRGGGTAVMEGIRRRREVREAQVEDEEIGLLQQAPALIGQVGAEIAGFRKIPGVGGLLAGEAATGAGGATAASRVLRRAILEGGAGAAVEMAIGLAETGDLGEASRRGQFGFLAAGGLGAVGGRFAERGARRAAIARATRAAQAEEDVLIEGIQKRITAGTANTGRITRSDRLLSSSTTPASTPGGNLQDEIAGALQSQVQREPRRIPARTGGNTPGTRRGTAGQIDLGPGNQTMLEEASQISRGQTRSRGAILADPLPVGIERQAAARTQADELVASLEREIQEAQRGLTPEETRSLRRRAAESVDPSIQRELDFGETGAAFRTVEARPEIPLDAPDGVMPNVWARMDDAEREGLMRGRARAADRIADITTGRAPQRAATNLSADELRAAGRLDEAAAKETEMKGKLDDFFGGGGGGGTGGKLFTGIPDVGDISRAFTARSGGAVVGGAAGAQEGGRQARESGTNEGAGTLIGGATGAAAGFIAGAGAQRLGGTQFIRRNFTVNGLLPEGVFNRKVLKDASTNSLLQQVRYTTRDFNRALSEAYGDIRSVSPEELGRVDQVLKGELDPRRIPPILRPVVAQMRQEIDALSQRLIDDGIVEGPLAARISENKGFYTTRAYQVFDDPKWASKVAPEVRAKAHAMIRQEIAKAEPGIAAAELERRTEGKILELLDQEGSSPLGFIRGQQVGAKDLSILRRRGDIAPEIRALWGEFDNPLVNYSRSVEKMARLVENESFLRGVARDGKGRYLFDAPVSTADGDFIEQIAAEGSDRMSPLNGLYTTKEIALGFRDAVEGAGDLPGWLRPYMAVNSAVKFSKTIGSVMTHVRNTIGNVGFAVANGHVNVFKAGEALHTTAAGVSRFGSQEAKQFYRQMQELGVINESANVGELIDALKDATGRTTNPFEAMAQRTQNKIVRGAVKAGGTALQVAQDAYRAEDDVWKIFGFLNERDRLARALPDMAADQVDARAAQIIRDTYPTYSLVPRGVKALRRVPLVGTFVSFPAEVIRVSHNTAKLALSELSDPNPAIRKIGAQRLAGMAMAGGGTAAAAGATRWKNGITPEEDEDIRTMVPPWSRNSQLFYLNKTAEGQYRYIDMSYTDPYAYMKKVAIAAMRGESIEDAAMAAGMEAMKPFLDEELLVGKLLDIQRNSRRETGLPVFNPEDTFENRTTDKMAHVWDALEPGTISSMQRIWKGVTNETAIYGGNYDPVDEAMATVTGMRRSTLDPVQAVSFQAGEFMRRKQNATRIFSQDLTSRGRVSDDQLRESWASMLAAREANYTELIDMVDAAQRLGSTDRAGAFASLKARGVSEREAALLVNGIIPDLTISNQRITDLVRSRIAGLERGSDNFTETQAETRSRLKLWQELVATANQQQIPGNEERREARRQRNQ